MPSLHDFRSDFRRGRTGDGLRINQGAKAYTASMFDADNFMINNSGEAIRRWPTEIKTTLLGEARLEGAELGVTDALRFLMVFTNARLDIYDMSDLTTPRQSFTSQPWTSTTQWFMTITKENNRFIIADETFQTQVLEFDTGALTFSMAGFEFDVANNGTRLRAPFFSFAASDMTATPTIFTSIGSETNVGAEIATALGILASTFDLDLGTGSITTSADFFVADHVGTRMRLGEGEFEVTAVNSATNADIKVFRDIAILLDVDPFFCTRGETRVEVTAFNHGLSPGDEVFFFGLSVETTDYAKSWLTGAPEADGTCSGTAQTYTVKKIVDENNFEVIGNAGAAQATGLYGGSSVKMIPASGIKGVSEPAFSEARGWPQAAMYHETRLWLGGTVSLPDAVWGSSPFAYKDFDTGDGGPDDAVQMYGIGEQSRVRHFVSNFDLLIFTENGEYYTPGSAEQSITQETARALNATKHGISFTEPQTFDGAIFFVDRTGGHVRELQIRTSDVGYYAPPASIVVPDWIDQPKHSTQYPGSPEQVTPYIFFGNDGTGKLVVMHSSRNDDSFGFMRWSLKNGSFVSTGAVGQRLFASAERAGTHYLLEFKTDGDFPNMDFAEELTGASLTSWTSSYFNSTTLQLVSERQQYSDITTDVSGNFTTPEALDAIQIGDPMPYTLEMNAPIAGSGQGPKAGKMQRLVSAEISWENTETGQITGTGNLGDSGAIAALEAEDNPSFAAPTPIDEWREYYLGTWGREPRLKITGENPGHVGIRGLVMNVYF